MEEGTEAMQRWFDEIPKKRAEALHILDELIPKLETFLLLSHIAVYNHQQEAGQYKDYQGDRSFVVSELIALLALRHDYVSASMVDPYETSTIIEQIQQKGNDFFNFTNLLEIQGHLPANNYSIEGIASLQRREEIAIRNPGIPQHHLEIAQELFQPLDPEIKAALGFSVADSVVLRKQLLGLINRKIQNSIHEAEQQGYELSKEVYYYRTSGQLPDDGKLTLQQLKELNQLSRKEIRTQCNDFYRNEMYLHYGNIYSFTAEELGEFSGIPVLTTQHFLDRFSCTFPSSIDENILSPSHILKSKPIIRHEGRYLIPSYPLLTWCVEPEVERYIKSSAKLQNVFKSSRHEYLLQKGLGLLASIFGSGVTMHSNLEYFTPDKSEGYETDALFSWEKTLFVVEGKGHRISERSRKGDIKRTKKHFQQIVEYAYKQGMRTIDYIRNKEEAEFFDHKRRKILFRRKDYNEYVIISLTLEPVGSITPLLRATEESGFFRQGIFPWIVSLYDLMVIAEHLPLPALLLHYVQRRKAFLQINMMQVYEEMDLLAYYLSNRLYIEHLLEDAQDTGVDWIHMGTNTDEINHYYLHKNQTDQPPVSKVLPKIPPMILGILIALHDSPIPHRQEVALRLLDMSPASMKKFDDYIQTVKKMYVKDGKKHDCAVMTILAGRKIGFTYMTGPDLNDIITTLFEYSEYKLLQMQADIWIGVGDVNRSTDSFDIRTGYIAYKK